MALTGKAKTDYQRKYMRRRRSNLPLMTDPPKVLDLEPSVRPDVRPSLGTMRKITKNYPTQGKVCGELTKARQVSRKGYNE